MEQQGQGTYTILLLIVHEGSNGPTLIGMRPSLSMNTDGSMANAKMVNSTRDGVTNARHCNQDKYIVTRYL